MRMKEEDWDAVIETNLRSVYRLSKACLRGMMKARGGRIIIFHRLSVRWAMPGRPIMRLQSGHDGIHPLAGARDRLEGNYGQCGGPRVYRHGT